MAAGCSTDEPATGLRASSTSYRFSNTGRPRFSFALRPETSDAVGLPSCVAGLGGWGREGGGFVVVLAGDQAMVQAA